MRRALRAVTVAMLEALLSELRGADKPGNDPEDDEMPSIMTGPETYLENPGHRGDELMHADARRSAWRAEDEIHDRAHGTRKIGF